MSSSSSEDFCAKYKFGDAFCAGAHICLFVWKVWSENRACCLVAAYDDWAIDAAQHKRQSYTCDNPIYGIVVVTLYGVKWQHAMRHVACLFGTMSRGLEQTLLSPIPHTMLRIIIISTFSVVHTLITGRLYIRQPTCRMFTIISGNYNILYRVYSRIYAVDVLRLLFADVELHHHSRYGVLSLVMLWLFTEIENVQNPTYEYEIEHSSAYISVFMLSASHWGCSSTQMHTI